VDLPRKVPDGEASEGSVAGGAPVANFHDAGAQSGVDVEFSIDDVVVDEGGEEGAVERSVLDPERPFGQANVARRGWIREVFGGFRD